MVAALLSIISFTPSIENRLSDSADAQVVSTSFNKDVQGATMVTTSANSTNPTPCGNGTQILGLQYANGSEDLLLLGHGGCGADREAEPVPERGPGQQQRGMCEQLLDAGLPRRRVPDRGRQPLGHRDVHHPVRREPGSAELCGNTPGYEAGWVSVAQVESVSLPITYAASSYKQTLFAVPSGGVNASGGGVGREPHLQLWLRDGEHGNLRLDPVLPGLHGVEHPRRDDFL